MYLTAESIQGRVPVTVLRIQGDLDASTYLSLIVKGQELYRDGTRDLLLDLSGVAYMSSSGLMALHSTAVLLRGELPPDPESGWGAFHTMDHDRGSGFQPHLKLLAPQPQVQRLLDVTGLKKMFEIFTDEREAVASF